MQDFTAALSTTPDLAHGMRKLGQFRAAFEDDARRLGARHGWRYDIDEQALARMFFDWIDAIGAQADGARANRADFTLFCGGCAAPRRGRTRREGRHRGEIRSSRTTASPGSGRKACSTSISASAWCRRCSSRNSARRRRSIPRSTT